MIMAKTGEHAKDGIGNVGQAPKHRDTRMENLLSECRDEVKVSGVGFRSMKA